MASGYMIVSEIPRSAGDHKLATASCSSLSWSSRTNSLLIQRRSLDMIQCVIGADTSQMPNSLHHESPCTLDESRCRYCGTCQFFQMSTTPTANIRARLKFHHQGSFQGRFRVSLSAACPAGGFLSVTATPSFNQECRVRACRLFAQLAGPLHVGYFFFENTISFRFSILSTYSTTILSTAEVMSVPSKVQAIFNRVWRSSGMFI